MPKRDANQGNPISDFLREKRLSQGLTQNQMAKRFDISPEVYAEWERGASLPRLDETFALLQMLGSNGREQFGLFLGPILDEVRGTPDTERGRAFDALAMILERAPTAERVAWVGRLEKAAVEASNGKKRSASVENNRKPRRK